MEQEIKLGKSDVEKIKETSGIDEIIDDSELEEMKAARNKIGTNYVLFAKLFVECHDLLVANVDRLENSKNLKEFLQSFSFDSLRDALAYYGSGNKFGDYYREMTIRAYVLATREKMLSLIEVFFMIFGGDE